MKYLDFIATYLGFSPDGRDPLWELAALTVIVTLVVLVGLLPVNPPKGTKRLD